MVNSDSWTCTAESNIFMSSVALLEHENVSQAAVQTIISFLSSHRIILNLGGRNLLLKRKPK